MRQTRPDCPAYIGLFQKKLLLTKNLIRIKAFKYEYFLILYKIKNFFK